MGTTHLIHLSDLLLNAFTKGVTDESLSEGYIIASPGRITCQLDIQAKHADYDDIPYTLNAHDFLPWTWISTNEGKVADSDEPGISFGHYDHRCHAG